MSRRTRSPWSVLETVGRAGALLLSLALGLTPRTATAQDEPVRITFLDVGQGDAVLVQAPDGRTALVDAGPGVGVTSALEDLGVTQLDLVVATHPHADHIGGMLQVIRSVPVRFYMDNGDPYTTATYLSLMRELRSRPDITYLEAVPRTLTLGPVRVEVLPLPPLRSPNPNEQSIGIVVEYGDFRAFLSGDSEAPELLHWVRSGVVPDVTLLKAPHHGSDDSVSDAFLRMARPELVVISVGAGNTYGHPAPSALRTYARYAERVYRTDLNGQVSVSGYEDGRFEVALGTASVAVGAGAAAAGRKKTASAPAPASRPRAPGLSISVFADAPGNDHQNTNGEYAIVSNASGETVDLSGWTLCDAARHCFRFPPGASVPGGGQVVLYTGRGRAGAGRFYMGSGRAVWNNDGDTATLYDDAGAVVVRYAY